MYDRYGALLRFKPGVSEEEIAKALNKIRDVLDLPRDKDFRWSNVVRSYNPAWGEPVWYIP